MNQGVTDKDESKVKIISGISEQEGISVQLRQDKDSAKIYIVRMKASYQELSKRLGSRQFEDVSNEKTANCYYAKIVFGCVQAFNMVEVIESLNIKHPGSKRKNRMSNRRSYNVTRTRTRSSREEETSRREQSQRKDNARKITRPS